MARFLAHRLRTRSVGTAAKDRTQLRAIWRFAQTVGPARYGAVTHPGAKAETHVYADA